MAHSTSGAPSERNATSASNHTSASADAQTSPRPHKAFPLRFLAGALAHWQIIASAVLLGGGVAGLAATYDDYCGMTELSYAPAALRSDFEAQARYLGELRTRLAKYASNEDQLQDVVLAGYNAGPGSVEKYGGVPPFPETQNYVKTIRELADTKYKLTCSPEYQFKQAKLSFVNGVTPAMAGVHADGTPLSTEESASAAAEVSASASASASARPSTSASARSSAKPSATGR